MNGEVTGARRLVSTTCGDFVRLPNADTELLVVSVPFCGNISPALCHFLATSFTSYSKTQLFCPATCNLVIFSSLFLYLQQERLSLCFDLERVRERESQRERERKTERERERER